MKIANVLVRRAALSLLLPLTLSGCAGLATQVGQQAAPSSQATDALDAITTAGAFSEGLDFDSMSLSGGADLTTQSLASGGGFGVLSVDPASLSPYVGPYPASFGRTTASALARPHIDVTNRAGVHRIETWYADGSYSRQILEAAGGLREDVIAAPWVATDSVPAPMGQEIAMPASASIDMAAMRWFVYDDDKTALGYRWRILDDSTGVKRLSSWVRAFQISGFDQDFNITTLDHMDISTDYQTVPSAWGLASQRVPYEHFSDDYDPASQARQTAQSTYAIDPASGDGIWTTQATITKNAPNFPLAISSTYDVDTQTRSKTISFTNKTGHQVVITENFRRNHSGTGSISLDGTQISLIGWRADGKGIMKFTDGGERTFHVR